MIVRRTRGDLMKLLAKSDVPPERWAQVLLACTAELAEQTLEHYEAHGYPRRSPDSETVPALPPLMFCNGRRVTPAVVLHCTLSDLHEGRCVFEEAP